MKRLTVPRALAIAAVAITCMAPAQASAGEVDKTARACTLQLGGTYGYPYPKALEPSSGSFSAFGYIHCGLESWTFWVYGTHRSQALGRGLEMKLVGSASTGIAGKTWTPRVEIDVLAETATIQLSTSDGKLLGHGVGVYGDSCLASASGCGTFQLLSQLNFVVSTD